jgi:hypothetical protein
MPSRSSEVSQRPDTRRDPLRLEGTGPGLTSSSYGPCAAGVLWEAETFKWRAEVQVTTPGEATEGEGQGGGEGEAEETATGEVTVVGTFDDEVSAAVAYDKAALQLLGPSATVNFPKAAPASKATNGPSQANNKNHPPNGYAPCRPPLSPPPAPA